MSGIDASGIVHYEWGAVGSHQYRLVTWTYPASMQGQVDGPLTNSVNGFIPGNLNSAR